MEEVKTRTKPCYHFRTFKCQDYKEINNCWHSTNMLSVQAFPLFCALKSVETDLNSRECPIKLYIFSSFFGDKNLEGLNVKSCLLWATEKWVQNCNKLWQIFVFICFTMLIPLLVCTFSDSRLDKWIGTKLETGYWILDTGY